MQPPIFILSMERSGSTLLRYLLDAHPLIWSPDELYFGPLCYQLALLFGVKPPGSPEDDPASSLITFRDQNLRERRLLMPISLRKKIHDAVAALIEPYLLEQRKSILCEKTPRNWSYAELLHAIFPAARFLCLHRHCLDVCSSCLEAMKIGFGQGLAPYVRQTPGNVVEALARAWVDKTSSLLRFERTAGASCYRIRYEDLVTSPAPRLRSIFEFLQVENDEDLLDRAFTSAHEQRPGHGDYKIPYTNAIHKESVNRDDRIYLDILPGEVAEPVNRLLSELGYQL
jgi:protein-tyrosine sulfotransferase